MESLKKIMVQNFFSRIFSALVIFFLAFISNLSAENNASSPVYNFQSETVWAKISVLVAVAPGHFHLDGQSDTSSAGWFLKDEKDRKIAQGVPDGSNHFQADVPQPFQGFFHLTILVQGSDGEVPVVIDLSPSGETVFLTPTPPLYDTFVEDPTRHYNKIVENFYDQAAQAYVDGDKDKALEFLEKARAVDPAQPQVLSLMDKLKNESENLASKVAIESATTDWKAGDGEKAISELNDLLAQYPEDDPALQLKKEILKNQAAKTVVSKKHKIKHAAVPTPASKNSQPALSEKDRQSQADEAYNLGLESYRKEDYASAKKFWEETLKLDPTHAQARRNLDRLTTEHPELK